MIPVYVINLDRQPERWDRIKRNADDIGVTLTRVPALDRKRDYGPDLEKEFGRRRGLDHDKVSAGDICCSLSHVRVWREILNSGAPAAVVLEDDMRLDAVFASYLDDGFREAADHAGLNCVKLEHVPDDPRRNKRRRPLGRAVSDLPHAGGASLYRLCGPFLASGAYFITREAVGDLLRRHPPLGLAIDQVLFDQVLGTGFRMLDIGFVNPAPAKHDLLEVQSDLENHRLSHRAEVEGRGTVRGGEALRKRLRIEAAGLRRSLYKLTGARKVQVEFSGDRARGG